jgi:hypothetical protein
MDDRIRVSDADRERVTARLREHFAEGRLTSDELDERISAALGAKTFGDLRRIMADLPEPAPVPPQVGRPAPWAGRQPVFFGRGPRIFPLALLVLIIALAIPGARWLAFAFFPLVLAFWLVACLAGIFAAARMRRHWRRHWQAGDGPYWHSHWRRHWQAGDGPYWHSHWRQHR